VKYTLDLQSPDYAVLLSAVRSQIVAMAVHANKQALLFGRTSRQHREATAYVNTLKLCEAALQDAQASATPERALQSTETPARNVSDDLGMVYGRPRNDPRDARTGTKRYPRK
jgi:hypothetical protein